VTVILYAICDGQAAAPACEGVGGYPLRMVRAEGLAALVSEAPEGPPGVGEQDLWQHESAVEALMAEHDVLPVRFGTRVDGDEQAQALLRGRAQEFRSGLERVAGTFELAVRASLAKPTGPAAQRATSDSPGASYMEGLKVREELVEELDRRIAGALGPIARASRSKRPRATPSSLSTAHLVERDRLGEFRERAAQLAGEVEFAEVFCTGPWPPYSFVGTEENG
jgi:hypothetical protein